jgi:transglutaminase-like putative cysteine protease
MKESFFTETRRILGLVLLIISIALLLSFIKSISFSPSGFTGILGSQPAGKTEAAPLPSGFTLSDSGLTNLSSQSSPPHVPVFFVEGLNNETNHLRLYTAYRYVNGVWAEEEGDYADKPSPIPGRITRFRVTPIATFPKHIPVPAYTIFNTADAGYEADTMSFLVENYSTPYMGVAVSFDHSENALRDGKYGKYRKYTEMSFYGAEEIRKLTLKVTKDAKTDYEKIKAIERFLEENYEYDPATTFGDHPVYEFLFVKKAGICKHFASAFVAMARSIGLPARAVVGYLAKPVSYNQTVFQDQAHMWAEVMMENGWMEVDPTPTSDMRKIPTSTKITFIDTEVRTGENLTLKGVVRAETGKPSGFVEIYITPDKNIKGDLIGLLPVEDGVFRGELPVPDLAGEYHVIAHYTGGLLFRESWSDPVVRIYRPTKIDAAIPRISTGKLTISGTLIDYNGTPLDGEIKVYVDDSLLDTVRTKNGSFSFSLELGRGVHNIKLRYEGDDFQLPAELVGRVEVGQVEVELTNITAVRGEVWESGGVVRFNGRGLSTPVIVQTEFGRAESYATNGNFSFRMGVPNAQNVQLGRQKATIILPEINYSTKADIYVKSRVKLDVKADGNLEVRIYDDSGNPAEGFVRVGNQRKYAKGFAVFQEYEGDTVYFEGSERYLPASKEIPKPFPFWILIIPAPVAAYLVTRMLRERRSFLEFVYDEPPIYEPGEEILVRIINGGEGIVRAALGKAKSGDVEKEAEPLGLGEKELEVKATLSEGDYLLKAERLVEGKVVEVKTMELRVMPYPDGIAEIFSRFVEDVERKRKISLENLTAREILEMLGLDDLDDHQVKQRAIELFEGAKYGRIHIGRKELKEFWEIVNRLRRELDV